MTSPTVSCAHRCRTRCGSPCTSTRCVPATRIVTHVAGDLVGPARLEIEPTATGCDARLAWSLELHDPVLRPLATLTRPAMQWAHDRVVDVGLSEFRRRARRRSRAAVTARRRRSRDGAIRVATFNIRHGATVDDLVRPVALARACAALDPDVLGLQEVERGNRRSWYVDQGRFVAAYLRARYVAGPAVRRSRWRTYGNGLVARGRIRDVEVVDLPRGPEREPRSAVLAVVTVGETAHLGRGHAPPAPPGAPAASAERRRRASSAPSSTRSVRGPAPRLLLGDLNLQPPAAQPILESAGFTVAEHGPTYPADVPRIRLDYVAVDGLRVGDVRVAAPATVSDHRAVVADLVP